MLRRLLIIIALLLPLTLIGRAPNVQAVQCTPGAPGCLPIDFTLLPLVATADGFTGTIFNSNRPNVRAYICIGTDAICQAHPITDPNFWKQVTATPVPGEFDYTFVYTGLRSSRTYTSIVVKMIDTADQSTSRTGGPVTTWPGYAFTPTESNVGQNSATINWTTPFPGDSKVVYGVNPPAWSLGSLSILPSDRLWSLSASNDSQAWAGTQSGSIYHLLNGAWTQQTNPDQPASNRLLSSSDAFSNTNVWFVGYQGITLHTSNGGTTWQVLPLPGNSQTNLYSVVSAAQDTAWAVGQNSTIYFYNGTSWQQKYSTGTGILFSVVSVDNKKIWAVGSENRVVNSSDGGATWATEILPGAATDSIASITTLDGQTIWASGSVGKIWRYTPSTPTWIQIPSVPIQTVTSLVQLSTDELWFSIGTNVGHITNAASATPIFTYTSTGSNINAVSPARASQILVISNQNQYIYKQLGTTLTDSIPTVTHTIPLIPPLNALLPGTPYYYAAESFGSGVGSGSFGTFTTPSPDSIPPVITITDPTDDPHYVRTNTYTIRGTISDNARLGSLTCLDMTNHNPVAITITPNLPISDAINGVNATWQAVVTLGVTDGPTSVTCAVSDGNSANDRSDSVTIIRDTVPPNLTVTNPEPLSPIIYSGSPLPLAGNVTDTNPLDQMDYVLNGGTPVRFSPPGVNGPWSTTMTGMIVGENDLTVHAYDQAGNQATAGHLFNYAEPTFDLSAAPPSQTISGGQSATYTITLTPKFGFIGGVNLSLAGNPAGSTITMPASVNLSGGPAATSLNIQTAAAPTGRFNMNLTAQSGAITKTVSIELNITTPPDFTLSVTPSQLDLVAGNNGSYPVSVTANSTFAGPITFSVTGLPALTTGTFAAASLTPGNSETKNTSLDITTQSTAATGDYSLTITAIGKNTATGATISHTRTVILHLSPAPDFSMTIGVVRGTVTAGSPPAASYNVTLTAVNGFNNPVQLSLISNPADNTNVIEDFSPAIVTTFPKTVTLNVTVNSAFQSTGNVLLTIQGHADAANGIPAIDRSAAASMFVTGDTTPPVIFNEAESVSDHDATITWETSEPADSMITIYSDAAQTQPIGITNGPPATFCTSVCHSLVTSVMLSPRTTYYYSITSVDQAFPTGNPATKKVNGVIPLQFTTAAAPDFTKPTVIITAPPAGDVSGTVTVRATGSDDNPMDHLQLHINTTPPTDTTIVCPVNVLSCDLNHTWNTLAADSPNGTYTITVTAYSTSGGVDYGSASDTRVVNVNNDRTPPMLKCIDEVPGCEPGPVATGLVCLNEKCSISIHWKTDVPSTSQVEYGLAVYCTDTDARQLPDGTFIQCAYDSQVGNPVDFSPASMVTDHLVQLSNLQPDSLYHYRITSCKANLYCTN